MFEGRRPFDFRCRLPWTLEVFVLRDCVSNVVGWLGRVTLSHGGDLRRPPRRQKKELMRLDTST